MRKLSLNAIRFHHLCKLIVTLYIIMQFLVPDVAGNASYYVVAQPYVAVGLPPVVLEEGTVGDSTIYANSTSAKVSVAAPVWLSGWGKRVKISIDHNDIDSVLSDFPVLIYLSSSSGRDKDDVTFVFDEVGSNSKRIAVTTDDGTTQCYVEIEKWNATSEQAWLWVKVPSISNVTDTVLYLYYDNDNADNTAYIGDKGSTPARDVWDSNFKGVWHLDENPAGTAPQMKDSTSNGNDGTSAGSMTLSDQINAMVDGGLDFDGSNDEITCGNAASLQITTQITIEAWARTSVSGSVMGIVNKEIGSPDYRGYQLRKHSDNHYIFQISDSQVVTSDSAYTDSNWHYIVGVRRDGINYLYVDGVQQTATSTVAITDSGANFDIGRAYSNYDGYWWNGAIDEVRVSNTSRSAAWIKAGYESERDDLLDFGQEDYVDNNASDVDSSPDKGTHSNFTAQQYGPDSVYDTLTETNTGITYVTGTGSKGTGSSSSGSAITINAGYFVLIHIALASTTYSVSSVTLGSASASLLAGPVDRDTARSYLYYYMAASNLGSVTPTVTLASSGRHAWTLVVYSGVDPSNPYSGYVYNTGSGSSPQTASATVTASGNLVVSGVAFVDSNLGSYTITVNPAGGETERQEQDQVGAALGRATSSQIQEYDTTEQRTMSATGTCSGRTLNWVMQAVTLNAISSNCELDLEVQWTGVDYDETNEYLCIKTGDFSNTNGETLKVDIWNGVGWVTVISQLQPNTWNNVSVSSYLTSPTFTIRFKGGNETDDTSQSNWQIDATLLHVWTSYDYVLKVVNQVTDNWTVNLQVYDSSNIGRISNLNISFYDGATSNQIAISSGSIAMSEGEPYDLQGGSGSTIYISMNNLQANSSGTSYLYVHLKILVPNKSTYSLYIITFEIT